MAPTAWFMGDIRWEGLAAEVSTPTGRVGAAAGCGRARPALRSSPAACTGRGRRRVTWCRVMQKKEESSI